MRHLRAFIALTLLATFLGAATPASALKPAHLWSRVYGNAGLTDFAETVAVDPLGNVYITGSFQGTINLGGSDLVSAGATDIFLAKFNRDGVHLWSQRFGSTTSDVGTALALDAAGAIVFLTGSFQGTVNFGGSDLVSAGGSDVYLARFSTATGAHSWSQRYGSTLADESFALATDGTSPIVVGSFQGTVSFGGVNLVSAGSTDIFVAKYSSTGSHQWSQRFGSTGGDSGSAIAVDASSNVVIAGYFSLTVNFGGSNLTATGVDMFIAKYNSAGTHQWSLGFGSVSSDEVNSVAVDASGNVLVTGYFQGTVDFGGGNLISAGGREIFFARFSSAGAHQLSKRFGSTLPEEGNWIAVDATGNIFVAGLMNGTVDLGGGNLVSAGSSDAFLAKYNSAGTHQWSARYGSTGADAAEAIVLDPVSKDLLIFGTFIGTVDFGGGSITGPGSIDVFLAKYGAEEPAEPVIASVLDISNDQGRKVRINFSRSGVDDASALEPVVRYEAYRRNDAAPSMTASAGEPTARALLAQGWTEVGSIHAHSDADYSIEAPTVGDSTVALGQYRSVFYIRAATNAPAAFYDSPADSGYSKDNLAPGVPLNFIYTAGDLSWNESTAEDFDFFIVYGSNTDAFGAATVVDYSVAAAMDVTASPYVFYYVTATDFSGNEGKPAKVNTLSGVGGAPKSYVLSVSNFPNPFNPRTTVSYTVPSRGEVNISIYDVRGALVATLFNGDRSAGAYTIEWDGRGQSGTPVSTGVYLARIEHASGTRSKKMVLLK